MTTVWREYGVIAVLMVVAIGGYLFVSRHQDDLLAMTLDAIGTQLLALVPDDEGRNRVEASLDRFKERVAAREVEPGQVEQFAASVLNLGSAGVPLEADEAELVVQLALDEAPELPIPQAASAGAARKTIVKPSQEDLEALAERISPMLAFFQSVKPDMAVDTLSGVPVRFYAESGGLHVVVDDRYREKMEQAEAARVLLDDRAVSWRARFADASQAERERLSAREIMVTSMAVPDSVSIQHSLEHLKRLRRLETLGVVTHQDVDSLVLVIETHVMKTLADGPAALAAPGPTGLRVNR